MIDFLGFILILTACYATGKIFVRVNFDYQILFVSRFYVGIFLISLLLFIVLWKFEKFFPLYCKSLIIYGLLYLVYKIINFKSIFNNFKIIIKKIKFIDFTLIAILLLYFPSILFPPTAADSLSYHFVIPKYILKIQEWSTTLHFIFICLIYFNYLLQLPITYLDMNI